MDSGIYTAYSGMKAQMDALDILANNLANVGTPGYKEEKAFFTVLNQSMEEPANPLRLNAVINSQPIVAQAVPNTSAGSLLSTQRDLDVALVGDGFFAVQTPQGVRYSRNGGFHLNSQSVLSTGDGFPLLGENGNPIVLGTGSVKIDEEGGVYLNDARVGKLKIVGFEPAALKKEGSSLYAVSAQQTVSKPASVQVKQGYLEQSNVNPITAVVGLIGIMRQFEAIQKSVNVVMNDMNAKSIEKLSR